MPKNNSSAHSSTLIPANQNSELERESVSVGKKKERLVSGRATGRLPTGSSQHPHRLHSSQKGVIFGPYTVTFVCDFQILIVRKSGIFIN